MCGSWTGVVLVLAVQGLRDKAGFHSQNVFFEVWMDEAFVRVNLRTKPAEYFSDACTCKPIKGNRPNQAVFFRLKRSF